MVTYIIKEIPHNHKVPEGEKEQVVIHEIHMPEYREPRWYITTISWDAFFSGEKKWASARDKQVFRSNCNWGPKSMFYYNHDNPVTAAWEQKENETAASLERVLNKPVVSLATYSRIRHVSLWHFYKYIGFDHKKRMYVDAKGKIIKFSLY